MKQFDDESMSDLFAVLSELITSAMDTAARAYRPDNNGKNPFKDVIGDVSSIDFDIKDRDNRTLRISLVQDQNDPDEYVMEMYPDPSEIRNSLHMVHTSSMESLHPEDEDADIYADIGMDNLEEFSFGPGGLEHKEEMARQNGGFEYMNPGVYQTMRKTVDTFNMQEEGFRESVKYAFEEMVGFHAEYLLNPKRCSKVKKMASDDLLLFHMKSVYRRLATADRKETEQIFRKVIKRCIDMITSGGMDPNIKIPPDNDDINAFSDRNLFIAMRSHWHDITQSLVSSMGMGYQRPLVYSNLEQMLSLTPENIAAFYGNELDEKWNSRAEELSDIVSDACKEYKKMAAMPAAKRKGFDFNLGTKAAAAKIEKPLKELWEYLSRTFEKTLGRPLKASDIKVGLYVEFKRSVFAIFTYVVGKANNLILPRTKAVWDLMNAFADYLGFDKERGKK